MYQARVPMKTVHYISFISNIFIIHAVFHRIFWNAICVKKKKKIITKTHCQCMSIVDIFLYFPIFVLCFCNRRHNCYPSSKSMPSIISSLDIKSPTGFSSWTACKNHLDGGRHAGILSWQLVNSWLSNQGLLGMESVSICPWYLQKKTISSPRIEVFQFLPPICSFSQAASSASQLSLQEAEKPAPPASLWIFLFSTSVACNVCRW